MKVVVLTVALLFCPLLLFAQEPRTPGIISPRIEAIRGQLNAGQTTDAFWDQAKRDGTPLVDPTGTDGKYQLATFVWRGGAETQNIAVIGSFSVPGFKRNDYVMARLGASDLWYVTVKVPAGARFSYRLAVNGMPRADPLNPLHIACPPNIPASSCPSRAELPGAVSQRWAANVPGTPEGKIEARQIKSELLQQDRSISVYTPPAYRAGGSPYSLLVLFDAEIYLNADRGMPATLNNLIAAGKIPPTVTVFVNQLNRIEELYLNAKFGDFVANELVPWVGAQYNVTKDPRQTVVGGFSVGGLASVYLGLRHSDVFGNVLSNSGSLFAAPGYGPGDQPDTTTEPTILAKEFLRRERLPLKFYLDTGVFEADSVGTGGRILEATRHLRDVLLAKGYPVHYQLFVGGHDGLSWRGTVADGLIALLGAN